MLLAEKRQGHYDRKILIVTISAALLLSSFVTGSQFIQPSIAQIGQEAKERVGGAVGPLAGGNQTGNQSGRVLGQLGDQAKSLIPTTRPEFHEFSQPLTTANDTQGSNQTSSSSLNVATGESPNILLIVADDLGWSDLKPYGGDIISPNLDALANQSLLFTNFHAMPLCSPTRSVFLTGVDVHKNGMGTMDVMLTPNQKGKPGYETYLNDRVTTVAEILRDSGYHTYLSGKWHLGHNQENWPYNRGFEESFALLNGGGTMWNGSFPIDAYKVTWANNSQLVPYPNGKYSSDLYADDIIDMIAKNHGDNKPFFGYLAFQANHFPLGAPANYLNANEGRYDMGWDKLREHRLDNQKKLGVITESAELSPRAAEVKPWDQLTAAEMSNESKKMEVYAATAQAMDYNIGKVLDYLKKIGEYDNTLIIFASDNGGESQVVEHLKLTPDITSDVQKYLLTLNNTEANMGNWNSLVSYGPGWAQVSNTPFNGFKGQLTEGGIRLPFLMKLPSSNQTHEIVNDFATGDDLIPTFLDYANATYPDTYKGNKIEPLAGKSILPFLEQNNLANLHPENETIPLEYLGQEAVYKGNWKAINLPKELGGDNQWHLYDIGIDPQESNDLSKEQPALTKELITAYDQYANQSLIIPPDYAYLGLSVPDETAVEG